jgi:serine/threonine protein phosphatase PrpC
MSFGEADLVEADLEKLVHAREAAAGHGSSQFHMASMAASVWWRTQPAYYQEGDSFPNTGNALAYATSVADSPALIFAVADGNYKDEASYLACAAVVATVRAELGGSFLAEADIAPALRRALLDVDERVRRIADAPIGARQLNSSVGARTNLRGISTSALVAVIARGHVWIAHAGECRARIIREGQPKELIAPHLLKYNAAFRDHVLEEPAGSTHADVVTNLLGIGNAPRIDVICAPVVSGERLIFGGGGLGSVTLKGSAAELATLNGQEMTDSLVSAIREGAAWVNVVVGVIDVH